MEKKLQIKNLPNGFSVYPDGIDESKKSIYHFYVPAYLANQLSKKGHSKEFSFALPYLFNRYYEVSNYNRNESKDAGSLLWKFVKVNDDFPSKEMLSEKVNAIDMYHGYSGALFGINAHSENKVKIEDADNFVQTLQVNGRTAFRDKIKELSDESN